MTCRDFENIVGYLAAGSRTVGSLIEAGLRNRALRHSAVCPVCAARLKAEQALDAGLRALAESDESRQAPPRLKFALRAAFDQRDKVSTAPVLSFTSLRARAWARWSLAAAALILFALTTTLLSRNITLNSNNMSGGVGLEPTPTPAPKQDPPRIILPDNREHKAEKLLAGSSDSSIKRRAQRRVTASSTAIEDVASKSETVTDYIPLTYLADATAVESGIVVRVELSPSTLIAMGLPINVERTDSRVKADVVLGDDGVARAVRFVR